MLRVGDIVTVREGLPDGANPEYLVNRAWRSDSGDIKYKLYNYPGRNFREEELSLADKPNPCPHQFNVGDRVLNIETDTVDVIETTTRGTNCVWYTLKNSLKSKRDQDLRLANYTLF